GYEAQLQYAEDDISVQVNQIETMIADGVEVLVVAAIDGKQLTSVLQGAKDAGIPVISYDRLILNSPNIDYYATFDNFQVGVQQGTYIKDALQLDTAPGPFEVELFGGSPDDNNAYFFFDGAMSVLQPYITAGKLVVKSGQMDMGKIATLRWDAATAQQRMAALLATHYADAAVDAVLSPYDGMSIGIITSLKAAGYGTAEKPLPVVTGQDAELESVRSIIAGEQSQTVYKDTRELAEVAVDMAQAVLEGREPEINDTETYDNGAKIVPSYLLQPVSVDETNYEEVLVGGGYYTADQLG
ncbi:multiple monosaccharide ABC transporter substrate-binding protein, partial [Kineococcus glutinatus]|uniref:multiple monosaccharide ABC transporter substrate-binding protein n=1 Tax=Kineococcus glutinatus TaxID=1070872 RepID=UPI0031E71F54